MSLKDSVPLQRMTQLKPGVLIREGLIYGDPGAPPDAPSSWILVLIRVLIMERDMEEDWFHPDGPESWGQVTWEVLVEGRVEERTWRFRENRIRGDGMVDYRVLV